MVEVFSEVQHGVDVDPEHFILFVWWEVLYVGAVCKCDRVDLFFKDVLVFVVEGVA